MSQQNMVWWCVVLGVMVTLGLLPMLPASPAWGDDKAAVAADAASVRGTPVAAPVLAARARVELTYTGTLAPVGEMLIGGGGSLVGGVNSVTDAMKNAGGEALRKATASQVISLEGYLAERTDRPWLVTLKVGEPELKIPEELQPQVRESLVRESELLVAMLGEWSAELTARQVLELKLKGQTRLAVPEPFEMLSRWQGRELVLVLHRTLAPAVVGLKFMKVGPGGLRVVETLPTATPAVVEVMFNRAPEAGEHLVELKAGGEVLKLTAQRVDENPLRFMTPAFVVRHQDGQSSKASDTSHDGEAGEAGQAASEMIQPKTETAVRASGISDADVVATKALSLAGRWRVEYGDAMLGVVKGEALGSRDGSEVSIALKHPQGGERFTLRSTRVVWDDDEVTIDLAGRSPNSERVNRVDVSRYPQLLARAEHQEMLVRVKDKGERIGLAKLARVDGDRVVLRLKRGADGTLVGRWVQQADALTERDELGFGRVGRYRDVQTEHGLAGEQSGEELWIQQKMVIDAVVPVRDQLSMDYGEPRYQYARAVRGGDGKMTWQAEDGVRVLLVVGENLPKNKQEKTDLISGDAAHVAYRIHGYPGRGFNEYTEDFDRGWTRLREHLGAWSDKKADARYEELRDKEALLVWADVAARTKPGRQSFTLNETLGQWTLKFGDNDGRIGFARATSETEYELTETLFSPESVRIKMVSKHDLPVDEVPLVFGVNGQVKALADGPTVMAKRWTPPADETVQANEREPQPTVYLSPEIALYDNDAMKPTERAGVYRLKVKAGDKLHVMIGDAGLLNALPEVASAQVHHTPGELGSLWKEALKQAAECKGIKIDDWSHVGQKKAHEIENLILFEGTKIGEGTVLGNKVTVADGRLRPKTRSIRVNVGDHAAMILLREEFIRMMERQVKAYDRLQGPHAAMGFSELIRQHCGNKHHPFSLIMVTAPNGHDVGISAVFQQDWVREHFKLTQDQFYQWKYAALREGLNRFRKDMRNTLQKARDTQVCDVPGLIHLTGWGFDAVAAQLTPRLMKLEEYGNPKRLHWVPDRVARGYVNGLSVLANAVRDQKDYSDMDTAVAVTVASLVAVPLAAAESAILAGGALVLDVAAMGQTMLQEVPEFFERREETTFARGAAVVLGTQRVRDAVAREKSPLELYTAILGAAAGTGFSAADAIPKIRKAIKNMPVEAMRRAGSRVSNGLEEGGLDAFKKLPSEEQATFVTFAADAKHAREVGGVEVLTKQQKQVLEMADRLQTEARAEAQAKRALDAAGGGDEAGVMRGVDDPADAGVSGARVDGGEPEMALGHGAGDGVLDRTVPPGYADGEPRGLASVIEKRLGPDVPDVMTPAPRPMEVPAGGSRAGDAPSAPREVGEVAAGPRDPIELQPPREPAMSNRPPPRDPAEMADAPRGSAGSTGSPRSTGSSGSPGSPSPVRPVASADPGGSARALDPAASAGSARPAVARQPVSNVEPVAGRPRTAGGRNEGGLSASGAGAMANRAPGGSEDFYPVPAARNEGGRLIPADDSPTWMPPGKADAPVSGGSRRPVVSEPERVVPGVNRPRDVVARDPVANGPEVGPPNVNRPVDVEPVRASGVADDSPTIAPPREGLGGDAGRSNLPGERIEPAGPVARAEPVGRVEPAYRVEPGAIQPAAGLPPAGKPWVPRPGAKPIELGAVIGEGKYATVYEIKGATGKTEGVVKIYRSPYGSTTSASETVHEIVKGSRLMGDDIPQLKILHADADAPLPYVIQEAAGSEMKLFKNKPTPEEFEPELQEAVVTLYKKFADKGLIWEDGHFGNIYFFRDQTGKMTAGVLDTDRITMFTDRSGKFGEMLEVIEHFPAMDGYSRNNILSLSGAKMPMGTAGGPLFPDAEFFMEKMLEYGGPGRQWMKFNGDAFERVLIDPRIAAKHFKGMPDHVNYDFVANAPAVDRPVFRVEGADPRVTEMLAKSQPMGLEPGSTLVKRGGAELDDASDALRQQMDAAKQRMARLEKEGGSAEAIVYHKYRLDDLEQRAEILKHVQGEAKAGDGVALSQADMDWLTGKRRALSVPEMRQARKMIEENFGGEWSEVTDGLLKGSATDELLLHKALTFRKQEVDTLLRQAMNEVEAMTGQKLEKQAFGSTNMTSDYDLSIKGDGAEVAVIRFNEKFRAKYGKEAGTFFDTNVYTAPVYDFINSGSTAGKRLSPAQQDVVRQFMYEQVANAKYMEPDQWSRHMEAMVDSVPADVRQTYRRLMEEIESKQHAAEQAVRRKLQDSGVSADLASDDEILRARNQLYETSLERINNLRKLKRSLDQMAAGRLPDLEGLDELARGGRASGGKDVGIGDTKFGQDVIDYYALKRAGSTTEADELLAELQSAVNSQLRHNQGDALYYASEAYQTQGTIGHVVQDLQASGRGKTLTGEALLGRPPAAEDLPLSRGQYVNSYQENNANLYKELNGVKRKLAKAGAKVDGTLSDVFRRVDPSGMQGDAAYALKKLVNKGGTKASKYFVRQLDAAHRAGVDLNEVLPDRLRYVVKKTVTLEQARSSSEAFAAVLNGEPAVTAQQFTADALEAGGILARQVNARSAVLGELKALAANYQELDSMMNALRAEAKGARRYDAAKLRAYLGDEPLPRSGTGTVTSDYPYPPVAGVRREIAIPKTEKMEAAGSEIDLKVASAGRDWQGPDGRTLQLGEKLGEGKYSEVYGLRDRADEAVKLLTRGEGDAFKQWTPAQTAERARQVSDELAEAGIPQLKVNEVRTQGDEAYMIVQKKRDGMEVFDNKTFTQTSRDQMIAQGRWTKEHEQAVGELFSKLAAKGFVWEDCHIGNMYFERVDGKLVAGVLDHGRITKWDAPDEIMGNWIVRMQIQPRSHLILSNVGRGFRYEFTGPREFMGKMLEHKGWIKFNAKTGTFEPGLLSPHSLDPNEFPLNDWVNPDLRKPQASGPRRPSTSDWLHMAA